MPETNTTLTSTNGKEKPEGASPVVGEVHHTSQRVMVREETHISVRECDLECASRLDALLLQVNEALARDLDEQVQKELGSLAQTIADIADADRVRNRWALITTAQIAVSALLGTQAKTKLAASVRRKLAWRVAMLRHPFGQLFLSNSPSLMVLCGLGTLFYLTFFFAPFIAAVWLPEVKSFISGQASLTIEGINGSLLLLGGLAGLAGSITSIMVRLQDFADKRNLDPFVLFSNGFFKPLVGALLAVFVLATLESGIIPIDIEPDKKSYFILTLCFITGFSERFAMDVASKVESRVGDAPGQ